MKELALVYPVLNEDKAKEADAMFCKFIQSVFDKRIVSSVFLTGEGFKITGIRSHCGCFAMEEEHLSEIICTAKELAILHTENCICI